MKNTPALKASTQIRIIVIAGLLKPVWLALQLRA
jgi:hypothetical protein